MLDIFGTAATRFRLPAAGSPHPLHPGWPESTQSVQLPDGVEVRLRPLLRGDGPDWRRMRIADEDYLRPVEPTAHESWRSAHSQAAWRSNLMSLRDLAKRGIVVPLTIVVDGNFAGQVTLGNIQHGSVSSCWIGYWVFSRYMGRGVATAACALGTDHAFDRIGLHRVTATYLPSNPASGAVLATTGFREEGLLLRNLHIDGQWRDHHHVAQTVGDHPTTCVARLKAAGRIR